MPTAPSMRAVAGLFAIICTLAIVAGWAGPARADERILSFDSTVTVNPDASYDVVETITVNAEGDRIRRGIFRDFPTVYEMPGGYVRKVGFDVMSVEKNGQPEPWFTENKGRYERVYIGDKDTYLQPGRYTYTIAYHTDRQMGFFADHDEVYWNVTGNYWDFPIDRVTGRIDLPQGASIGDVSGYTGYSGARGTDFRVERPDASTVVIETTRPLARHEGLTVAVSFQKGIVAEPSQTAQWFDRLFDNLGYAILLAGLFAVAYYYLVTWGRVGRDPQGGVIIPLFAPPAGLSPAATSYLHFMDFKSNSRGGSRAFIAALVDLAVKGVIRIEADDDEEITLHRQPVSGDTRLPGGEAAIYAGLLKGSDSITFDRAAARTVMQAQGRFETAISREYGDAFFRNNYAWFVLGAVLSALTVIGYLLFQTLDDGQAFGSIGLAVASTIATYIGYIGLANLFGWEPGGGSLARGIVFTLAGAVICIVALVALGASLAYFPWYVPVAIVALGVMSPLFMFLMRAPTVAGRKVMDQIEGFKLYLTVAEKERLNMPQAPEMSTTLFERFLPYAVGLGVEKPWSDAFAAHLARTTGGEAGDYRPAWYSGSNWDSSDLGRATAGMVGAVAGGMAAATPASSGSSGSGGGGFSGGGGGGGGGGGW